MEGSVDSELQVEGVSLGNLLHPLSTQTFRSEFLGKKYRLFSGEPTRFSHLLTHAELCRCIASEAYDPSTLKLVHRGVEIPQERYLQAGPQGRAQLERPMFEALFKGGSACVAPNIHRYHKRLWRVSGLLESLVGAEVNINVYSGGPTSRGFDLHVDNHDVFVLQVKGSKRWKVGAPTYPAPLVLPEHFGEPPTEMLWAGVLEPGDMLYIPRGYWHRAEAREEEATLHLSCGVQPCTGLHVVHWLAGKLMENSEFREELPRFESAKSLDNRRERLALLFSEAWDKKSWEQFLVEHYNRLQVERRAFEQEHFKEDNNELRS